MPDNLSNVTALSGETAVTVIFIPTPSVSYSITGGADRALFVLGGDSMLSPSATRLSFAQRPDVSAPADAGADNLYEVEVTASYSGTTQSTLYRVQLIPDDHRGDTTTTDVVLTDGSPVSGRIDLSSDRDWFRFESTGGTYMFISRGVNGFSIHNADGSERLSMWSSNTSNITPQFENLPAGTYFLNVGGNPSSAAHMNDYLFSVAASSPAAIIAGDGDDTRTGGALADFIAGNGGNDTIYGLGGADLLAGVTGDDVLFGGDGNDILMGGSGANTIDGGAGYDVARFTDSRSFYTVAATSTGWQVRGADSVDVLTNVEALEFSDQLATPIASFLQIPTLVTSQIQNILRGNATLGSNLEVAARVVSGLSSGSMTTQTALQEIVKAADATTSVATLSYQFFTGKIPSQGGIDYLVSTTGGNANSLNSVYYQSFSMENRYINFAVNLGKYGEGHSSFEASYGPKSLFDATKTAYATIFGMTPTDAKTHALIDGRADYFVAYGGDGDNGIGTKAAMVGWLLAEAAKADIGTYSKSNDAFLTDLADGAPFAVDLIGTYGRPDYALT